MTTLTVYNFVISLLVILQAQNGYAAPTHHLAISVEGSTPTLIASSSDVGITPKMWHPITKLDITFSTVGPTSKENNFNALKITKAKFPKHQLAREINALQPASTTAETLTKTLKRNRTTPDGLKLAQKKVDKASEKANNQLKSTENPDFQISDELEPKQTTTKAHQLTASENKGINNSEKRPRDMQSISITINDNDVLGADHENTGEVSLFATSNAPRNSLITEQREATISPTSRNISLNISTIPNMAETELNVTLDVNTISSMQYKETSNSGDIDIKSAANTQQMKKTLPLVLTTYTNADNFALVRENNNSDIMATEVLASVTNAYSNTERYKHDSAVKLIDLEKYNLKVLTEEKQQKHGSPSYDNSHDGVNRTTKKQLTERRFLNDTKFSFSKSMDENNSSGNGSTDETISITFNELKTTAKPVPEKMVKNIITVTSPAPAMPTSLPILNKYLGPIFMGDKIFNVNYGNKKAQPQHEEFIESQLRAGRIVEIIAPTELIEQTTTQDDKNSTTATKQPPTINIPKHAESIAVLSTTVFQVPEKLTSDIHMPVNTNSMQELVDYNDKKTESKISDIQIEVYDSTVESIIASTNFKDKDGHYPLLPESAVGVTIPPLSVATQQRFTQYVVDRTDSSTQESTIAQLDFVNTSMPEPAAIEIHINVSEGINNNNEDLDFTYHQPDYSLNSQSNMADNSFTRTLKAIAVRPINIGSVVQNNSNCGNNERNDEILVVELIDVNDNNTENTNSSEIANPTFTFRSNADIKFELETKKSFLEKNAAKSSQMSDELFLADMKKNYTKFPRLPPAPPPPPPPAKQTNDRDSDTIFYISNTEVKVGESLPTTISNYEQQQLKRTKLENQFFPIRYVGTSTHPNIENIDDTVYRQHRYQEDIILSPVSNTADSLKIFRTQGDGAPPLDVTYVGESIMEVEQSSGAGILSSSPSKISDVVIQPAILPEMSIGVPVIGELPPQIELKEVDFKMDEAKKYHSNVFDSNIENNISGNDVDRIVESSIQYGGDLIDGDAGGGFDGVEGSYPFGNPDWMHGRNHHHSVSNFRKDVLSVDVTSTGEIISRAGIDNTTTLKEFFNINEETSANISLDVLPHITNATTFSIMGDLNKGTDEEEDLLSPYTIVIGILIVILPIAVTISMACILRSVFKALKSGAFFNENTGVGDGNWHGDGVQQKSTRSPLTETMSDFNKDLMLKNMNLNDISQKMSSNIFTLSTVYEYNDEQNSQVICTVSRDKSSNAEIGMSTSAINNNTGPNGSITKMTLKNNHILIVETEERNDISRDAREMKMDFSSSTKDGIFVVEVARGVDSKTILDSPILNSERLSFYEAKFNNCASKQIEDESVLKCHEEVQIHQPPQEITKLNVSEELKMKLHQIDEIDETTPSSLHSVVASRSAHSIFHNTGLSQSDLSSTSSDDSNKRYSYGNQELYIVEQSEYGTVSLATNILYPLPFSEALEDNDQNSENGHNTEYLTEKYNENHEYEIINISNPNSGQCVSSTSDEHHVNGCNEEAKVNLSKELNKCMCQNSIDPIKISGDPILIQKSSTPMSAETEKEGYVVKGTGQNAVSTFNLINDDINGRFNVNDINKIFDSSAVTHDDIVDLPDPPTNEEKKMPNHFSLIEISQLDSLPPPPPNLLGKMSNNKIMYDKATYHTLAQIENPLPTITNNNAQKCKGSDGTSPYTALLQSPSVSLDIPAHGELLAEPLTPPASPPLSPLSEPAHCSNAINGGICCQLTVAVNVNGS